MRGGGEDRRVEQPRHPALPPGSLACGVGVAWLYMVWDRLLAPASWEPSSTREVRTALCRGSVCEGSQHFRQRTLFKGACGYTRPHEADGPPPSSPHCQPGVHRPSLLSDGDRWIRRPCQLPGDCSSSKRCWPPAHPGPWLGGSAPATESRHRQQEPVWAEHNRAGDKQHPSRTVSSGRERCRPGA